MKCHSHATVAGLAGAVCLGLWVSLAVGQTAAPKPEGLVVLDTAGFWRMHHTMQGPVADVDGTLQVLPVSAADKGESKGWDKNLAPPSPAPPADWTKPECDDSTWFRGPARRACRTPYLARLCLRGAFQVDHPKDVKDLKVSLTFHGGAAVYVNGKEIGRKHLSAGAAMAEAYPAEAFVDANGGLITLRGDPAMWRQPPAPEVLKRIQSRDREFSVAVPEGVLRAGRNMLAVEIVRAPYHKAVVEQMQISKNHGDHKVYELSWNTCEVLGVRLTAASGVGVSIPASTGSRAVRKSSGLWSSDPLAVDYDLDFGDDGDERGAAASITLVGARNGIYSGKVVWGSTEPIRGLTATCGDLKGESGAVIPSASIRVRYGMPWGDPAMVNQGNNEVLPYPAEPSALMALYDSPPAEVPVYTKPVTPRCLQAPGQPAPVFGAVLPIWVTVHVPKDAKPGTYTGPLTIDVPGLDRKAAPAAVCVKVVDYTLPDPRDCATWMEVLQCPDTLVLEYGLEPWSAKHWEMIARSMGLLREVGNRVVFAPLIAETHLGNAESIVRWVKKGENEYDYDFSILDKYLDLAEKQMGKPEVVVFNVWDRYLTRKGAKSRDYQMESSLKVAIKGPLVTLAAAPGQKAENVMLPDLEEAASKPLWKNLFDQPRERMRKRGLEKAMHIGMTSDFWATKEQAAFFQEATGGLPWASAGHYAPKDFYPGVADFGYQSSFFGARFGFVTSLAGWKGAKPYCLFERVALDAFPVTRWRTICEASITGNTRGVSRIGGDLWAAVKDKSGKRIARANERFPRGNWGYLGINCSTLAPGPEGPVATQRLEALREGFQECEARILLERALSDAAAKSKLGDALAARCQRVLDERHVAMWRGIGLWQAGARYEHEATSWRGRPAPTGHTWFVGSGWQQRSEELYRLAGEVAAREGGH